MTLEDKLRQVGLRSNSTFENVINTLGNKYSKWKGYHVNFENVAYNGNLTRQISKEGHAEMGIEGNQENALNANQPANVRDFIEGMSETYKGIVTEYSEANFNQVLKNSPADLLHKEAKSMKPYKVDKVSHDNIVSVHNKFLEADAISRMGPQAMEDYIKSTVKPIFIPAFMRARFSDEAYLGQIFKNIVNSREANLKEQFKVEGNLDKKKLTNYITNNLSKSNADEKNGFYFSSAMNLYAIGRN
jgi:hypothetical protein